MAVPTQRRFLYLFLAVLVASDQFANAARSTVMVQSTTNLPVAPLTIISSVRTLITDLMSLYSNRMGLDSAIAQLIDAAAEAEKVCKLQHEICLEAPQACERADIQEGLAQVRASIDRSSREIKRYRSEWEGFKWVMASIYLSELNVLLTDIREAATTLSNIQGTLNEFISLETKQLVEENAHAVSEKLDIIHHEFESVSSDLVLSMAEKSVSELEIAALLRRATSADVKEESIKVQKFVSALAENISAQFRTMLEEAVSKITAQLTRIEKMVAKQNRRAEYDRYQKEFPSFLQAKCKVLSGMGSSDKEHRCQACFSFFSTAKPVELYRDLHMVYLDEQGLYRVPKPVQGDQFLAPPANQSPLARQISDSTQLMLVHSLTRLHQACVSNDCVDLERRFMRVSEFDDFRGMCSIMELPSNPNANATAILAAADRWAQQKAAQQEVEMAAIHKNVARSVAKLAAASARAKQLVATIQEERRVFDEDLLAYKTEKVHISQTLDNLRAKRNGDVQSIYKRRAERQQALREEMEASLRTGKDRESVTTPEKLHRQEDIEYVNSWNAWCSFFPDPEMGGPFVCCSCDFDPDSGDLVLPQKNGGDVCQATQCANHFYDSNINPDLPPSVNWMGSIAGYLKVTIGQYLFSCFCSDNKHPSHRIDMSVMVNIMKKNLKVLTIEEALGLTGMRPSTIQNIIRQ